MVGELARACLLLFFPQKGSLYPSKITCQTPIRPKPNKTNTIQLPISFPPSRSQESPGNHRGIPVFHPANTPKPFAENNNLPITQYACKNLVNLDFSIYCNHYTYTQNTPRGAPVDDQDVVLFSDAAQAPIAAQADVGEVRHALDVQMQQVAWGSGLVPLDWWRRVEVSPSAQPRAAQDAADRSRTGAGAARYLVTGPAAQLDNADRKALGETPRTGVRTRAAIPPLRQAGNASPTWRPSWGSRSTTNRHKSSRLRKLSRAFL
jgi:hypothetical protein